MFLCVININFLVLFSISSCHISAKQLLIKCYLKRYKPPSDFASQITPVQIMLFVCMCTINVTVILAPAESAMPWDLFIYKATLLAVVDLQYTL